MISLLVGILLFASAARSAQMLSVGPGPVLTKPVANVIFYGNFSKPLGSSPLANARETYLSYLEGLGTSPYWSVMSEYTDRKGKSVGPLKLGKVIDDSYSFGQVADPEKIIQRALDAGRFAYPPADGTFFIVFGADDVVFLTLDGMGNGTMSDLCQYACGGHSFYRPRNGQQDVYYSVIPVCHHCTADLTFEKCYCSFAPWYGQTHFSYNP